MAGSRDDAAAIARREREFFARHYARQDYNLTAWRLRVRRELRSVLAEKGTERLGRVLSVGCGDGAFEVTLAPHARSVLGIDLSPEAVEAARRAAEASGADNVEFRCTSAFDFDTDERFDTVLCIAFLHHVPLFEFDRFLAWLAARLAPGGLLYTQDPNVNGVLRKVGRVVLGSSYDRYHTPDERELDPGELAAALRRVGLTDVRTRGIDLTILPLGYVLARGPGFPFHACAWLDALWCATPLHRWASGFKAAARKP